MEDAACAAFDDLMNSAEIKALLNASELDDLKAPAYGHDAPGFLLEAADTIGNRASERDQDDGERSMARAVSMFNAWRGHESTYPLSETEGWIFMVFLKLARAAGGTYKRDDFVDGAAYMALAGECAEREAT